MTVVEESPRSTDSLTPLEAVERLVVSKDDSQSASERLFCVCKSVPFDLFSQAVERNREVLLAEMKNSLPRLKRSILTQLKPSSDDRNFSKKDQRLFCLEGVEGLPEALFLRECVKGVRGARKQTRVLYPCFSGQEELARGSFIFAKLRRPSVLEQPFTPQEERAFLRESVVSKKLLELHVRHILPIWGIFYKKQSVYKRGLLMPLCSEGSLVSFFQHRLNANMLHTISRLDKMNIAFQIVESIVDFHANGICHLDLKAGNILLDQRDGRLEVFIADLESVSRKGTRVSEIVSTFPSPEMKRAELMQEKITVSFEMDLWALGDLLFFIFFGVSLLSANCLVHQTEPIEFLKRAQLIPSNFPELFKEKIRDQSLGPHDDRFFEKIPLLFSYDPTRRPSAESVLNVLQDWFRDENTRVKALEENQEVS